MAHAKPQAMVGLLAPENAVVAVSYLFNVNFFVVEL